MQDGVPTSRYLSALDEMTRDPDLQSRAFARSTLRDLGERGVAIHDYLAPIATLPPQRLTAVERRLRYLATRPAAAV